MMYGNKLAAAVKVNGKVLREFNKDTVYIPFGSEYSILIKNLHTVRVLADIFIDGENVVPGGLVLMAGQEINLERAIKNGNLTEGNKFKFIERTGKVEEHRGVKLEDGLVRIEYKFEKPYVPPVNIWTTTFGNDNYKGSGPYYNYKSGNEWYGVSGATLGSVRSMSSTYSAVGAMSAEASSVKTEFLNVAQNAMQQEKMLSAEINEAGITVPGSKSEQKFQTASWFQTETEKHSLIFKILGQTENTPIVKPVTVKAKQKCTTCGTHNKAHAKFCRECGTALEIFA